MATNISKRARTLQAQAVPLLKNPILKTSGAAALIAEQLQLIAELADRVEQLEAQHGSR